MKRYFALIFVLIISSLLLLSCGDDGTQGGDNSDTEYTIPITGEGAPGYVIIRADMAGDVEREAAMNFRRSIEAATGAELGIATDWVKRGEEIKPGEFEILIGNTNRPESDLALEPNEFVIIFKPGRLVITGGSEAMIAEAVERFLETYVTEGGQLMLPESINMKDARIMAKSPTKGTQLEGATPTFEWYTVPGEITLRVTKADDPDTVVLEKKLTDATSYTATEGLDYCSAYSWSVSSENGETSVGGTFMTEYVAAEHPANRGLNFTFEGSMSREVLENYLSRMLNHTFLEGSASRLEEEIRLIKSTGAKYIGRACTQWTMGDWEFSVFDQYKATIEKVHEYDPEIIFESCIFETTARAIETIQIPAHVFEAFGLPVEERNFDYEAMIFKDGRFHDQWGDEISVPDMNRIETQMWFYYRGCLFIDMGFEALHMGQVMLMGQNDRNYADTTMVYNMIRDYAKEHARRGFVLINAHAYDIMGADGKLLMDFHIFPIRAAVPDSAVAHEATEGDPQVMMFRRNYKDSIYGRSIGGMTHSGWECDMLPYVVELDNYSGYDESKGNKAIDFWGYDEISWFANQPLSYKKEWLNYAWKWIREVDNGCGYLEMPGTRTAAIKDPLTGIHTQKFYYANSKLFDPNGMDVEFTIADIWVKSRDESY